MFYKCNHKYQIFLMESVGTPPTLSHFAYLLQQELPFEFSFA